MQVPRNLPLEDFTQSVAGPKHVQMHAMRLSCSLAWEASDRRLLSRWPPLEPEDWFWSTTTSSTYRTCPARSSIGPKT